MARVQSTKAEMPKSVILGRPSMSSNMLAGLMSRWTCVVGGVGGVRVRAYGGF